MTDFLRRAFGNKYLAALMIILMSCAANAQQPYWQKINTYSQFSGLKPGVFVIPSDTLSIAPQGSLAFMPDSSLYIKGLSVWFKLSSGGSGSLDTTALHNQIASKQPLISLGTTSQYFDGTLALRDFATSVRAVGDPTYSLLGHTHNPNEITGLTSYIRGTISVIGNGTYNSTTGVINITGGGTGTYNFASPLVNDGSGNISLPSIDASLIGSGTKTSAFISDFSSAGRGLITAQAPITYNATSGLIGVDSVSISGLINKGRLIKSLDSLRVLIGASSGVSFTPIGSLTLDGSNHLSLIGDSATTTGLKVYGRNGTSGGFYNTITFNNYTPVLGNVPVYDTANGGGYVNKPIQQITISKCQGCVPVYDTTAKNFTLTSYIPADFTGAQNGQILSTDIIHNKIVPIVPVYNNDSSLKVLMIDPVTSIPYIRNRIIDDGGFTIYNDSTRRLGGVMNYAADFTATSGNYMHFNGAVGSDGLSPYIFASPGSGFGTVYGGGIGLDATPNGGSAFGIFSTTSSSSRGRYNLAIFDKRRNTYVWAIDSTGRQWLNYAVGTHSRLGLWDSTGKINILSNGTVGQILTIGASGSPIWSNQTSAFDSTSLSNRINQKLNIADTTNKWQPKGSYALSSSLSALYTSIAGLMDSTGFVLTKVDGSKDTVLFNGIGSGGSSGISGLTANYIPVATSPTTIGNSSITVNAVSGSGAQQYGFNTSPSTAIVHSETGGSGNDLFKGTVTGTLKFKVVNNGNVYSAGIDDGAGGYRNIVSQGGYITSMQSKVLTDANYTITGVDGELVLPIPSATRTLTLPAASTLKGKNISIHNRGGVGQWVLSGSYIQTGNNGLTEDFVNSGLPSGKVIVLRSIDVGSGTWKWIQMNN